MDGKPPELYLRIQNNQEGLTAAQVQVRRFLCDHRIDDTCRAQVMVIVDELTSNIIRYAWTDNEPHGFDLGLSLQACEAGFNLTLTLTDDGTAFDPTQAHPANLALTLDSREPGGLGLVIVGKTSSRFEYRREAGHNHIKVGKRLRVVAGN